MILLKRVYDKPSKADGYRVLVDRLWPRGLTKERAAIDLWLKEVAPSPELRTWFSHDISKWTEFNRRYRSELDSKTRHIETLVQKSREGAVTLVYGARDEEHNGAVVLRNIITGGKAGPSARRTGAGVTRRYTSKGD